METAQAVPVSSKSLIRSSSQNRNKSRSRSKRTSSDEVIPDPPVVSALAMAPEEKPESPGHETKLEEFLYGKSTGNSHGLHSPISLICNIFTCWSRDRSKSSSFKDISGRPRINSFATAALLEQNRLQQEALVESQETRDMWEWQMEQQRLITCQEYGLVERNCLEIDPLVRSGLFEGVHGGRQRVQHSNAANDAEVLKQEDFADPNSEACHVGSESSGNSTVHSQFNHVPHEIGEVNSAVMLLFEAALLRCRSEINVFCRVYMQQMVSSGYTLLKTLMEIEPNTVFLNKVHTSYALESRINSALFRCFENDSFDDSGLTRIFEPSARALTRLQDYMRMKVVEPEEVLHARSSSYDSCFHSFCSDKSEEIMSLFSWDMGYHSAAEGDRFVGAFLKAAKWVWLLHKLANATNPSVQIMRVGRGQELEPTYLEAVVPPPSGSCQSCSAAASVPKVEFMVMPGFIAHHKIFKCRVYPHYMCR
ncbi:hypothetical protein KP509_16G001300 [Ceratopteris richardii]|uniref:GIL1/IRKI C-terminal domain-containing protein n=1 Tax=Ceratopteris richardii TaxID=49495 RepID=A0A8T2SXN4_CERRI|nr:hypothetical protein KP509_16G001300 [Ceratopteris richardii]